MANNPPKVEKAPYRKPDGTIAELIIPKTAVDVEQQPDIPACVLAVAALSPLVNGRRAWSRFTIYTLHRLQDQFGDHCLRLHLISLLVEMQGGFKPQNPIGIFIHRVRSTQTETTLS